MPPLEGLIPSHRRRPLLCPLSSPTAGRCLVNRNPNPTPNPTPLSGSVFVRLFALFHRMSLSCHVIVQRTRVQIWLYENTKMRIEGQILGFDEYMNLVLDEAEEVRTYGRYHSS